MPFEAFRARIETVRDPEVVNQWLEKMKKVTRYTSKAPVAEGQAAPAFDSLEEARAHLLATPATPSSSPSTTPASTARSSTRCRAARSSWRSRAPTSASCGSRSTPRTSCGAASARALHDLQEGLQGRLLCLRGEAQVPRPGPGVRGEHRQPDLVHRGAPAGQGGRARRRRCSGSARRRGRQRHPRAAREDHADAGRPHLARPRGLRDRVHRRRPLRAAGHGRGAQEGGRGRGGRPRELPGGAPRREGPAAPGGPPRIRGTPPEPRGGGARAPRRGRPDCGAGPEPAPSRVSPRVADLPPVA
jgi:hypothetical protein